MRLNCALAITLTTLLAGTAVAATYLDNHVVATQDCSKDPDASVVGNHNTVTFTGTCRSISVAGDHNRLTIASVKTLSVAGNHNTVGAGAADRIAVTGNRNHVTWKKGLSRKRPRVSNLGTRNSIARAR